MKPGRELDALVAEKVMGFNIARGRSIADPFAIKREGYDMDFIPHYSTSIADAWLVVEKMKYIEVDNISGVWSATAKYEDDLGYAESDTAPHAICLAALKAVGVEER